MSASREHASWVSKDPQPVESYVSASMHGDPFLYPGERPDLSFVTDGAMVNEVISGDYSGQGLSIATVQGNRPLDSYLEELGVPLIDERIPMVAFGANLCPSSLAMKFRKAGGLRPDLQVVPTLYADLPGYDVVWSGAPGINGNFIAQLYRGPQTKDTEVQIGVNFLTREQLLMMHSTELAYQLKPIELELGGKALRTYVYSGVDTIYQRDGDPVAIASVKAKGRNIDSQSTLATLEDVLRQGSVQEMLHERYPRLPQDDIDPQGYIELIKSLKPSLDDKSPRLGLKRAMTACLTVRDMARIVTTGSGDGIESWANPSTIPVLGEARVGAGHSSVYVLPEQELPTAGWDDSPQSLQLRNKILTSIGTHHVRTNPDLEKKGT